MTHWIIEPQDPLIVRDGRPFSATPGARAKSVSFPFPSTTAGGVRTRAGKDGNGRFDTTLVDQVKTIPHRGPFLVELDGEQVDTLLVPAPADALLFDARPVDGDCGESHEVPAPTDALLLDAPDKHLERKVLRPIRSPAGALTDLPDALTPVGLPEIDQRKPSKHAPRFWRWKEYEKWLLDPVDDLVTAADLGHAGPEADRRLHVAIDPATQTGIDGKLFMTSGLTFWRGKKSQPRLSQARRLALLVEADSGELPQRTGFDPLGGERRLMHWRPTSYELPKVPAQLAGQIAASGHCRVVLLTPACFAAGWGPDYLLQTRETVTPKLQAAIVGPPLVISGWDLAARGPKPTRRLVPAGSVYYLKMSRDEAADEAAIARWLEAICFRAISDEPADRADGFGIAAVGVWSGQPAELKLPKEANGNA